MDSPYCLADCQIVRLGSRIRRRSYVSPPVRPAPSRVFTHSSLRSVASRKPNSKPSSNSTEKAKNPSETTRSPS